MSFSSSCSSLVELLASECETPSKTPETHDENCESLPSTGQLCQDTKPPSTGQLCQDTKPSDEADFLNALDTALNVDTLQAGNGIDINSKDQTGKTFLHKVAESGSVKAVLVLIQKGCRLNIPDQEGKTPLDIAVMTNNIGVAKTLIKFNGVSHNPTTILHRAVRSSIEILKPLLTECYDIDSVNDQGQTALHIAIESNREGAVESLLGGGADVNRKCLEGKTPLYYAAENSTTGFIAKKLLALGAVVQVSDKYGLTPLHLASKKGNDDIVSLLIQNGAQVNSTTLSGLTPLHYASMTNHILTVRALLKAGANTKSKTLGGITPLAFSLMTSNFLISNELSKFGAKFHGVVSNHLLNLAAANGLMSLTAMILKESVGNINCKDNIGKTPLFHASEKGYLSIVKILIIHKASLDIPCTDKNYTPLHAANLNGHTQVANILMVAGAKVDCKDSSGNCPIHLAVVNSHLDLLNDHLCRKDLINLENSKGESVIHVACHNNKVDILNLLRKCGADVKKKDNYGNAIIHIAARFGHLDILSSLLDIFSVNDVGWWGRTPLHFAASENRVDIIKYLISKGADINIQDDCGLTPLHLAVEGAHVHSIEELLNNSADIEVKTGSHNTCVTDYNGQLFEKVYYEETPLLLATCLRDDGSCKEVMNMLLKAGACIKARDYEGQTALSLAIEEGHLKSIELLLQNGADDEDWSKYLSSASHLPDTVQRELKIVFQKYK